MLAKEKTPLSSRNRISAGWENYIYINQIPPKALSEFAVLNNLRKYAFPGYLCCVHVMLSVPSPLHGWSLAGWDTAQPCCPLRDVLNLSVLNTNRKI